MKTFMTHRPLSDMESDGVYFPESVREKLEQDREKDVCQYSGLPSVWSYSDERIREVENNVIQNYP
jgi:hypothetical protein